MDDDHLIQTFYITKPHFQQFQPSMGDTSVETPEKEVENYSKNDMEDAIPSNQLQKNRKNIQFDSHYERSYRMISKQINCSAAVSISRNSKRNSFSKKKDDLNCNSNFMEQFEDYFKSFVPHEQKKESELKRRKSSKVKTRIFNKNPQSMASLTSSTDDNELEEQAKNQFIRSQNREHLTFYQKLKTKIGQKVNHLIDKNAKNKIHKVETKPKSKKTVEKILKQKNDLKECQSHLRLSRTGLVIRLDSMQTKVNDGNLRKIQNQKPKKDMIFQRCLIKNCEIVLQNLQNYEKERDNPPKKPKKQLHKRYNSSILQKTCSSQQKYHTQAPGSTQDLSVLKWRQKCLNIQLSCKQNFKRNGNLKEGIKVFGKYCSKMQKKMDFEQNTLKAMLNQNLQKDDEAYRVYDSMSNIQPIRNYLKSIE